MVWGSKPVDNGNFLLSEKEKEDLINAEPNSRKYIRPFISADEFLKNKTRWCLWLVGAEPNDLQQFPLILRRIENVREFRLKSKKLPTKIAAGYPSIFAELRQPINDFIFVPLTTSENRTYIPLGFFTSDFIINNSASVIPKASKFEFGVLSSFMHVVWVKHICGRLESRFRYSNTIVYNNFPWPENPTDKQKQVVEAAAQKVLDTRLQFPGSSLADLYDPLTMPPALVKAHQELDKAVDLCYRPQPFPNETKRIEYLFDLYEKYTAGIFGVEKKKLSKKPTPGRLPPTVNCQLPDVN